MPGTDGTDGTDCGKAAACNCGERKDCTGPIGHGGDCCNRWWAGRI